jgi:hypothetical protein
VLAKSKFHVNIASDLVCNPRNPSQLSLGGVRSNRLVHMTVKLLLEERPTACYDRPLECFAVRRVVLTWRKVRTSVLALSERYGLEFSVTNVRFLDDGR